MTTNMLDARYDGHAVFEEGAARSGVYGPLVCRWHRTTERRLVSTWQHVSQRDTAGSVRSGDSFPIETKITNEMRKSNRRADMTQGLPRALETILCFQAEASDLL
jgi:hypothetical protein